jgi:hypothetical protein
MSPDVCWQTETRAMRLQRDAERARAVLDGYTRKTPTEMIGKLSLEECIALGHQRWTRTFEEYSATFAEQPDMAPMPVFLMSGERWRAD